MGKKVSQVYYVDLRLFVGRTACSSFEMASRKKFGITL